MPWPNYHRDISGRIRFTPGYEPTVPELVDAAKDEFPHVDHSRVIVIIIGTRGSKSARLRLRSPDKNYVRYGPHDKPNAKAVLERAQDAFPRHHPSRITVGILTDGTVGTELCIGLTIPSIGHP